MSGAILQPPCRAAADFGVIFKLGTNDLRPDGRNSCDVAGLPILPGLVRYDEISHGEIKHAIRLTMRNTFQGYIHPATHYASSSTDSNLPPMGLRVRLKASVDISHLPPQARIVAVAMKRYGMILADNGSSWYVSGAPDPRWSNDDLHTLGRITGSDFEVVDTSSLPHPGQ